MQTINDVCRLYKILHALSNGPGRDLPSQPDFCHLFEWAESLTCGRHGSFFSLVEKCSALLPRERSSDLENSVELERVIKQVAVEGISEVPESAEEEVGYHMIRWG